MSDIMFIFVPVLFCALINYEKRYFHFVYTCNTFMLLLFYYTLIFYNDLLNGNNSKWLNIKNNFPKKKN